MVNAYKPITRLMRFRTRMFVWKIEREVAAQFACIGPRARVRLALFNESQKDGDNGQ